MNSPKVIFAIGLLLLPVLYVTSYLALVVPQGHFVQHAGGVSYRGEYRFGGKGLSPRIYWPIERIDCQLRPVAWEWQDIAGPGSISFFETNCTFGTDADLESESAWFGDVEFMELPTEYSAGTGALE